MFQKKAPRGIVGDEGVPGKKSSIPVEPAKKPKKGSKKSKPKKTSVAREGQKGKIAAMLGSKFAGKDLDFKGKGKTCSCKGDCDCGNEKFSGSNKGQSNQFVSEQKRFGIRG